MLTQDEEATWREALVEAQPQGADVVFLSGLAFKPADAWSTDVPYRGPDKPDGHSVVLMRKSAASLGAKLLVVYVRESQWGQRPNPLSILYGTIVGLWVSPGTTVEAQTIAQGVVVDVETGAVYGVVSGDGHRAGPTAAVYIDGAGDSMLKRTQRDALEELARHAGDLVAKLRER
jgi:hypothetical protein